jgi:hypothetical protein
VIHKNIQQIFQDYSKNGEYIDKESLLNFFKLHNIQKEINLDEKEKINFETFLMIMNK